MYVCVITVYIILNYCKCFHIWVNLLSSLSSLPLRLPSLPSRSATSLKDVTSYVLPVFIATQECHIAEGRDIFRSSCLHCHPGVPHCWRMRHLPFFLPSLPPRSATSLKDATSSVLPRFTFKYFEMISVSFDMRVVFVLLSCLHNSSSFLQEFNCKHFKIRSCCERYMSGSLCNYCILLYCKSLCLYGNLISKLDSSLCIRDLMRVYLCVYCYIHNLEDWIIWLSVL